MRLREIQMPDPALTATVSPAQEHLESGLGKDVHRYNFFEFLIL